MQFIESRQMTDYHCSPAEENAILDQIGRDNPGAFACMLVEGGVMVFDTYQEFKTWTEQA